MKIHLLIATRNGHKAGEIRSILGPEHRYTTLAELTGAPEVVEDAATFAGNATKKAVMLARWHASRQDPATTVGEVTYVLADDSGLEVDALGGAPGVHSARFAALEAGKREGAPEVTGANAPDAANNSRLLRLLAAVPAERRTARFRCVLALTPALPREPGTASPACEADGFELQTELFEGVCNGRLLFEPRGTNGFGYDPLFVPEGYELTFAELGEGVKNRLSHRARALEKLNTRLRGLGQGK